MRLAASPTERAPELAHWAVLLVFLLHGILIGSWAPHIPLVQERLGLGPAWLGFAILAAGLGGMLAMPLAGALVARHGSAPVLRAATLLFCLALPLPAIAPGFALLATGLFLFGAAAGTMDVAMNAHAVAVERALARPVMSRFHAMFSLGSLLGAAVGGLMLGRASFLLHPPLVTLAMLALALPTLRLLLPAAVDAGAEGPRFALPSRVTLGLGLLTVLAMTSEGAMLDWTGIHLRELGAGPGLAAAGFAAFSATMTLGRLLGDRLRARLGAVALVRGSGLLAAAGIAAGLASGSPLGAVLGFACAGLGLSNTVPLFFGAAGNLPGQPSSTSIAAVATLGYTGFLAGPAALGLVAEAAGLVTALSLVAVACAIVGLCAFMTRAADAAVAPMAASPVQA